MNTPLMRFPIRFDAWYRVLSTAVLLLPSRSYVQIEGDDVTVRMGWGFRARFRKSAVTSASLPAVRTLSRGVHGWWGRWLVNGSGNGIVLINLAPAPQGFVMGVPVKLRQLMVSVEDPDGLVAALGAPRDDRRR
jgi:hypothetical protein